MRRIILFISIILLSGCINLPNSGTPSEEYSNLELEIINIPQTIQNGQIINPILRIINKAKYTIPSEKMYVKILNTNNFIIDYNEQENSFQKITDSKYFINTLPINGKFLDTDFGDIYEFEFKGLEFNSFLSSGENTVFSIEQCYSYETQIITDICISKDSYGQNCNSLEKKLVKLGSDDIEINSYEQINSVASGPNVYATIKIEGKYSGSSNIAYNAEFDCSGDKKNKILFVKKIQIGSKVINNIPKYCGSDLIYLDNNDNFNIICNGLPTYDVWTKSSIDFTEKLTITLGYLKTNIISKDLTIV